jgi:hypothetical protein
MKRHLLAGCTHRTPLLRLVFQAKSAHRSIISELDRDDLVVNFDLQLTPSATHCGLGDSTNVRNPFSVFASLSMYEVDKQCWALAEGVHVFQVW